MESKRPIKKNDDITLKIDALTSEGQGIGRLDGFAVFVPGALPGESVLAHVIKVTSGYAVAKLLEITEAAENRVTPECDSFPACGGCALQHLDYSAQLDFKRQCVADALQRLGGLSNIEVRPALGMKRPWGYRNKGSFPLGEVDGRIYAGFYSPRSHRLIPTQACPIHDPAITAAVDCVCAWANEHGVSAYDEATGKGILRHVVARLTCSGELMVAVVSRSKLPYTEDLVSALQRCCNGISSVISNINPDNTNVILGKRSMLLFGEQTVEEHISGLDFQVGLLSFLQVNHAQTEVLYREVMAALELTENTDVCDVYCGVGAISLILAQHCGSVTGIESVEEAVEDAQKNAELNGIANARFLTGTAEEVLPRLVAEGYKPGAVVVDPPRKGCAPEVLAAIAKSGAERIVYVSCNPATLARDCKALAVEGYRVSYAQPLDMFPHTPHVETVVLLSKDW